MNNRWLKTLAWLFLACGSNVQAGDLAGETYSKYVDKHGDIRLPDDFRQRWAHLGSWVVEDSKSPGYGFHDVYAQPWAVDAFKRNGRFPDGTVLVKEIRGLSSGELTTGTAMWAADAKVWFVMIKDDKQRFPANRHWGEGWGWALFNASAPAVNVSSGYRDSCLACHMPAKASDWVFLSGYPDLRSKKGGGHVER
ncbi:MAG: cytochrome P460 family protein [Gammaproteobacteria bacterium]